MDILNSVNDFVENLIEEDSSLKEVVLYGSASYYPEVAKDVDLIVLTGSDKEFVQDIIFDLDFDYFIDAIIINKIQEISNNIGLAVLAFGKTIYGEGVIEKYLKEVIDVPDFKTAYAYIKHAEDDFKRGLMKKDMIDKEILVSSAFNKLFEGSRLAVQIFLCTKETRWGKLRNMLNGTIKSKFRRIINYCHLQYGYEKRFPNSVDILTREFYKWKQIVQEFIRDLETQIQDKNKDGKLKQLV